MKRFEVFPKVIFLPATPFTVEHNIIINNRHEREFLCYHVESPDPSAFSISPDSGIIPALSSYSVTFIKKKKARSRATELVVQGKYVSDITSLAEQGFGSSDLHEYRIKISNKKPEDTNETTNDRLELTEVDFKIPKVFPARDFSQLRITYGIPRPKREEYNYWKMRDLYYDAGIKKVVPVHHLREEVALYYCPICFKVFYDSHKFFGGCEKCMECPQCGCQTNVRREGKDSGGYFYQCNFCKWSSSSPQVKGKIIAAKTEDLGGAVQSLVEKNPRASQFHQEIMAGVEELYEEYQKKENFKKRSIEELNQLMTAYSDTESSESTFSRLPNASEKRKKRKIEEKNTKSANKIIQNPSNLMKVFAEKSFNSERVLSASQRSRHPGFFSVLRRENWPNRRKLLSKRKILTRPCKKGEKDTNLLLMRPKHTWKVNSMIYDPSWNCGNFFPTAEIIFFDRLIFNKESFVFLRLVNPSRKHEISVKLFPVKDYKRKLTIILNLPLSEFKICPNLEKEDEMKKVVEKTDKETSKMVKLFMKKRERNTVMIKFGVTPRQVRLSQKNSKNTVKFSLKTKVKFMDFEDKAHQTEFMINVRLGQVENDPKRM